MDEEHTSILCSVFSVLPTDLRTHLVHSLDPSTFFLLASTSHYFYQFRTEKHLEWLCKRTHGLPENYKLFVPGTDWKWLLEALYPGEERTDKPETFTGRGLFETPVGIYAGELVKGRRQGKGVMHYNDCTEYYGEWSADLKHGHGIFIWSNGDRYEGKLEENAFSGYGEFSWSSGNKYRGEWKDGLQHGYGVFTWESGDIYEGQWENHKQHGNGKLTWANGNFFEGEFDNGDKRAGKFLEKVTGREFNGKLEATGRIVLEDHMLYPGIMELLKENKCTYNFTKENFYFQYLYKTQESDGSTRRICISCFKKCVTLNHIELVSHVLLFGGNFICECGAGKLERKCNCLL